MRAALEPAATMQCSNDTVFGPVEVSTSIMWGELNRPFPCTTVTLRCFARTPKPLVSLPTTDSFQLRSLSLMLLTLITAPMGIIGVALGMLLFGKALGFVADLGILALSGMIIRNSVILIDQIQKHMAAGEDPWHAIIDSAVLRFRPIMLTAAAAILGMIPLMRSIFWGPMAVAIASGLFIATILTLLVLPTLYAAWFKVKKE